MTDETRDTRPSPTPDNRPLTTADMAGNAGTEVSTNESLYRTAGGSGVGRTNNAPLLNNNDLESFRQRWSTVQTGFVDEPRNAVEQADTLVAEVIQQLAQTFSAEKDKLESQWGRGQDVSTEDLRIAMQRYRSFFDRLLTL